MIIQQCMSMRSIALMFILLINFGKAQESSTFTSTPTFTPTSSDPSTTTLPGGDVISPEELRHNMRVIWIFGFTVMQFHLLGTLYVIIRTWLRWRRFGLLSMAQRFPFYLSCLDLMLYILYYFNGIPVLTQGHTLEPPAACKVVSGLIFYVVSTNMSLAGNIAVVTYLRVCRQIYINLGKYDERLLITSMVIPVVLVAIASPSFGSDTYWCYTNRENKVIPYLDLVLHFSLLIVCCYCYYRVVSTVFRTKKELVTSSVIIPPHVEVMENKVILKVISYILIFILNWTPNGPYVFGQVTNWTPFSVYLVSMLADTWGGVLNCIQYIVNEGFWIPPINLDVSSPSQLELSMPSSSERRVKNFSIHSSEFEIEIDGSRRTASSSTYVA